MIKLLITVLLLLPLTLVSGKVTKISNTNLKKSKVEVINEIDIQVSVYNPVMSQTDSTPLETASLKIIDTVKLKANKLKWVAISWDLKKKFKYGDTITITGIGKLSGKYMIADLMNKRYKNKVDILTYSMKYCKSNGKLSWKEKSFKNS